MTARTSRLLALLALVATAPAGRLVAQDRLKEMPGYARYREMSPQIPGSIKRGSLTVRWLDGGKAFEFSRDGKSYRYDVASRATTEAKPTGTAAPTGRGRRGGGGVERGRQAASATSPDGRLKAFHRDRNLWLADVSGAIEAPITTDGSEAARTKYGTASWVYGEELDQTTAIWWSPDSKKVAFYRFDEKDVRDYYLPMEQARVQDTLDVEPYPKAGAPNPVAEILVYDLASKKTTRVDLRDGKPFKDDVVGYYAYNVLWSVDSTLLLFNRTNRLQNVWEFTAADPESGHCRALVREEWPASWVENNPKVKFLEDGKRFILTSERSGFANLYLHDLTGKLLAALTSHPFEVGEVVRVDESKNELDYMARSGDNPMKLQLHRVGLDGKGDRRLTDPALHHEVNVAPDGRHFIDVAQAHDQPPATRLVDDSGKVVEELAKSDLSRFDALGLQRVELLTFKAGDGATPLYGLLHKPSRFDPKRKYPLLVTVYAGPATNGARETFATPQPITEYGFLVASFDSRSAGGRGKRALDAIYKRLGLVEIDDQAEGVKSIRDRPYVDGSRVGIFGTSYGGYASAMALLRHPEVFRAACAMSPVTDWKNYDTIYTERYMGLPDVEKAAYKAGSAMTYAEGLKGRLMLFYGTADNNVHPSNSLQLISALQAAGKSFEVQVGPDQGHSALRTDRMIEFFIENLVLARPPSGDGPGTTQASR